MLTATQANALGAKDRADGLTDDELRDVAESIADQFGGKAGKILSIAYRKGAGIR